MKRISKYGVIFAALFCFVTTAFAANNDYMNAPKALASAKQTNWVQMGSADAQHQLYVIAEPNCSACHYFYESIKPLIAKGDVQIRWILVTFIKPSSVGKAAAIIGAKDPVKAFEANEAGFISGSETGGIKPMDPVTPALKAKIDKNMAFMQKFGVSQTPTLVFQTTDGKPKIIAGSPPKEYLAQFVSKIGKY